MAYAAGSRQERLKGAAAAIAAQLAVGYVLVTGLATALPGAAPEALKIFGIAPEPPPPPPPPSIPPPVRNKRPEGAASPPNLRNKATEVTAPEPVVPIIVPPPVIVSLTPGTGAARNTGAAPVTGPGTGAGGIGTGTGSGNGGDGDGGGWEDETPPRWLRGRLSDRDYPRELGDSGIQGTVGVRYQVATDGRVRNCRIDRSSGSTILDRRTCDLIEQRFRFRPARDGGGRAVSSTIVENHEWAIFDEPPEPAPAPRRR